MKTISSRHNTAVQSFRELARTADATGARLLLDGAHLIEEARDAGLAFEVVAVAASRSADTEEGAIARALELEGVNVVVVNDTTITCTAPAGLPGPATITVQDNGRGIAPEDHERVFELFRRSGQQDQSGEGIGLANVRALAYRLGGTVTVRSVLSEGSTFVVDLPTEFSGEETE